MISAFLRAYNDRLDDERRQDLYRYAALVVGTRAAAEVELARAELCRRWRHEVLAAASEGTRGSSRCSTGS